MERNPSSTVVAPKAPVPGPLPAEPSISPSPMARLGDFVVRHRRAVLAFWFVVALAGLALVGDVTSRLSSTESLPGLPSYATSQRVMQLYGNGGDNAPVVIVVSLPSKVASPAGRAELAAALAPLSHDRSLRVLSYLASGDPRLLSDNGRTTAALVFGGNDEPSSAVLAARVRAQAPPGVRVAATNYYELGEGSNGGLGVLAEAVVAGFAALVVLAVVFGSLLAVVPVLVAVVSILSTFLLIGAVTTVAPVSALVEYLISLIGLGVAIDYSLLVVTRWREERGAGRPNHAAVAAAVATAGRTVAFSGVTVGIGLLALVVLPVPFLRSLGYAGILIPLVSVVVAVTLLPALLATIGPRLEWPHRRGASSARPSRAWSAWASAVVRHRKAAALCGLAVLGALVAFAPGIRVGEPLPGSMATSGPAAAGLRAMEAAGFPVGMLAPGEVLVPDKPVDASPALLAARLALLPGAYTATAPAGPQWHRGGTALVDVVPRTADTTPANTAFLHTLQTSLSAASPGPRRPATAWSSSTGCTRCTGG